MKALQNIIILWSVVNVSPKNIPDSPAAIAVNLPLCSHYYNYARIKYVKDCKFFYECHGGMTYLLKCPEHSWFDPTSEKCVFDETVCRKATEDKEEESDYTDSNKVTSHINRKYNYKKSIVNKDDNNEDTDDKQVSIIYKYVYITERSPRMIEDNHRRTLRNSSRLTLTDVDIDSDQSKSEEENIVSDEEEDDTSTEYSSDNTMTSSIIWMDQTTKRRRYPYGIEKRSTGSINSDEEDELDDELERTNNDEENDIKQNYKLQLKRFSKGDVVRSNYEDEKDIIQKYKLQLKRFSKRFKHRSDFDGTDYDTNNDEPEPTTVTVEETEVEENWDWESATRAPLKKIRIIKKEYAKKKESDDSIKYVNFGTYSAPHSPVPYKILGDYFQPYDNYTKKLIKRSHLNESSSSTETTNIDISNTTHRIIKRDGLHITLNLKDLKKKTDIESERQYYIHTALFDTTTPNTNSFEFFKKIFQPHLDNESSTLFEDPRHPKVSDIDLLIKLYEWKELNKDLNIKEKNNDHTDENVNLDKLLSITNKTGKFLLD